MGGRLVARLVLTICVLLLAWVFVAWAGSYGTFLFTTHRGRMVAVVGTEGRAQLHLQQLSKSEEYWYHQVIPALNRPNPKWAWAGFEIGSYDKRTTWNGSSWNTVPVVIIAAPFWVVALAVMGGTILVWLYGRRQRRRDRFGHCRGCGYNLRGIGSERCPECGEQVPGRPAERIEPSRPEIDLKATEV